MISIFLAWLFSGFVLIYGIVGLAVLALLAAGSVLLARYPRRPMRSSP